MTDRRFQPPWDIEEHNRSCFIVRDNNGQALSYVYSRPNPAGARPPTCLRAMSRGGLLRTSLISDGPLTAIKNKPREVHAPGVYLQVVALTCGLL